ncbi:hypothetical protein EalM132_00160 [Exiguobacterium phage vB_EalM-132]|nr:hypothetical protein EalM132_00160 [Exiguobacterium phage vB_EalM-132]
MMWIWLGIVLLVQILVSGAIIFKCLGHEGNPTVLAVKCFSALCLVIIWGSSMFYLIISGG